MNSDENRPNGIHVIEVLPQSETVNKDLEAAADSYSETWAHGNDTVTCDWMESGFKAGAEWQKAKDAKEIETMKNKYIIDIIPATVSQISIIREQTLLEVIEYLKRQHTMTILGDNAAIQLSKMIKAKLLPKREEQK